MEMVSDLIGVAVISAGWFIGACVLLWQSLYTLRTGDIYWGFWGSSARPIQLNRWWFVPPVESAFRRVCYALLYGAPAVFMFFILGGVVKRLVLPPMFVSDGAGTASLMLRFAVCVGAAAMLFIASCATSWRRRLGVDSEPGAFTLRGFAAVLIATGVRIVFRI